MSTAPLLVTPVPTRQAASKLLAAGPAPMFLAVAFAGLSVPLVAVALAQGPDAWIRDSADVPALNLAGALSLALASAWTGALVGGLAGSRLVRRRPIAATLFAIGAAWPMAIAMLSIASAALGVQFRGGIFCFDACKAYITSQDPLSGFGAWLMATFNPFNFAMLVVGLVVFVLAVVVRTRGHVSLGIVMTVVAYGVANFWSILLGGGAAFACLAVGVAVWAILLWWARPSPQAESGVTGAIVGGQELAPSEIVPAEASSPAER